MKTLVLTFLALASGGTSGAPGEPGFQGRIVFQPDRHALTLEARDQSVNICGARTDGPCRVLPSSKKISCFARRFVHCRRDTADRTLRFSSSIPAQCFV